MNCEFARPALTAFHLGALHAETFDALEAHLKTCPDCVGVCFAKRRALDDAAVVEERPSAAVRARVRGQFLALHPARRPWRTTRVALAAMAVAAVIWFVVTRFDSPLPAAVDGLVDSNTHFARVF